METPFVTTFLVVLVGAGWHWRFSRASRTRQGEAFSAACVKVGVLLLAFGIAVYGRRIGVPTPAETLAAIALDAGGATLVFLGLVGWATSNDSTIAVANLTGDTLVFVDSDGRLLFTLLPQFGRAVATLPPPLPGRYLIVSPALLESEEAASRSDLRVVDTASARRSGNGDRILVRRLRSRP
jgi:hypothetical protein